jgi:glycosyltransferase involved in cell wall biosynthesis
MHQTTKSSNMPKLLMVVGDFPPLISGVGDYTFCLSRELHIKGMHISVLTTCNYHQNIPLSYSSLNIMREMKKWSLVETKNIVKIVKKMGEDTIVHIQYHCPQTYGKKPLINLLPFILRLCCPRNRVIITHHDFQRVSWRFKLRALFMSIHCHGVICVKLADYISIKKKLDLLNISAVLTSVGSNIPAVTTNPEQISLKRKELGFGDNEIVVSFFGGMRPEKGFENLLRAIKFLRNEGINLRLLVIGGFEYPIESATEYALNVRNTLKKAEFENWATLVKAPLPETVANFLKASDYAVYPFRNGAGENNGSLLAALVNGIPVLTTRGIHTPEYFEDDFGAQTVPAGDLNELINAMRDLSNSSKKREDIKCKVKKIKLKIEWSKIADEAIRYYCLFAN